MLTRLALLGLPVVLVGGKSDGTCGYQCTADAECGGCGTAGKCSCPDGTADTTKFPQISCTCVSAPASPPNTTSDASDGAWPAKWTANVDAWCYSDFTNKTAPAAGKFYYDSVLGKTRADWKPYTNGRDATQVWIVDATSSHYYVKTGPFCIYFPITDPGQPGKPIIGIERADWMQKCKDSGFGKLVGREQVNVDGVDEWVDHWSCHLDYEAANQQITFQNWHSLGLGKAPKGLPLRVTGGNSAPNGSKGSPRLNSVWYKDFATGDNATKASDFEKPNWGFCIPVGMDAVKAFFGHVVTTTHTFNPSFHKRAHYFAHAKATNKDLMRARRPKPSLAFQGNTFQTTMQKLNSILLREKGLRTQQCEKFSLEHLHEIQRELFTARTHELDAVYHGAGDTRRMTHDSLESLEAEQSKVTKLANGLLTKAVHGACHEMVMWYIHHLSESAREEIKQRLVLPLLPEVQHEEPLQAASGEASEVHRRYTEQASCAVCHVTPASKETIVV